jgi:hypothetical protein
VLRLDLEVVRLLTVVLLREVCAGSPRSGGACGGVMRGGMCVSAVELDDWKKQETLVLECLGPRH